MQSGIALKHCLRKHLTLALLVFLPCLWTNPEAHACTLWAAAGSRVKGGGVIIAKNRDMPPDHRQELRLVKPPGGFRYLGLVAVDRDDASVKAGVNEKGLVIVDAAASWIVRLPPHGAPALYVELANPGESPVIRQLQLDASIWEK